MEQPRCPQHWKVFRVRGSTGTYGVIADDIQRGTWSCTCRAFIFGGRTTCKHIELVKRHGCFGGGPNDLASVSVEIAGVNPTHATEPTWRPCACGELMLAPKVWMRDHLERQIVQIEFGASAYTYANAGRDLAIGDSVNGGTVVALGSDFAGELKVIGNRAA